MNRILYTLAFLAYVSLLTACSENPARSSDTPGIRVDSSHSIYIQNGVLKRLQSDGKDVLYVYIRPANTGHWLATGGGGGVQDKPWLFKSASSWTLGDENLRYTASSPKKSFSFLFDSRNMTLVTDAGRYAVPEGGLIIITLDPNWKTASVKSGPESLRDFAMPDADRQQLVKKVLTYTRH